MKKIIIAIVLFSIILFSYSSFAYEVANSFRYPIDSNGWYESQDFGVWNSDWGGYHLGEDCVVYDNSELPVYAPANGVVKHNMNRTGYGRVVIIEHQLPDGSYVCSVHGHMRSSDIIAEGSDVSKGEVIGYLSNDSSENGGYNFTHLHFGIRKGGFPGKWTTDSCGKWSFAGYSCETVRNNDWHNPDVFINNNQAIEGYASVSNMNVPSSVCFDEYFDISVTLQEVEGADKTFENIAIAILDSSGNFIFDFAMFDNVTVPANGTWSEIASNSVLSSNPSGTYQAMIRGKYEGTWFDFDITNGGVNPTYFEVSSSCTNDGDIGDSCGAGMVYDCAMNCVDESQAQSWIGDGYCDDGSWGMDLICPAFDMDGCDCGCVVDPPAEEPGASCGSGMVYDCEMNCVDEAQAQSWIGDGYCDDGEWGLVLTCPAFSDDGGDCGGGGTDPVSDEPGASCGTGMVYDCDMQCVDESQAQSWIGDGYCDDGEWGLVLTCAAFSDDGGDCGGGGIDPVSDEPGASCGAGMVYDCDMQCVDESQAQSWIGDGYCDNGQWGMVLTCPAFENDGGDC